MPKSHPIAKPTQIHPPGDVMKYLIAIVFALAITACTQSAGNGAENPIDDPANVQSEPDPIEPTEPPVSALKGIYVGEMTGTLLETSTYKISVALFETPDGKFIDNGKGTGGPNYYQLWDQNQPLRKDNIPHYDGYATGNRSGSTLNLALRLNYYECFANLKAFVSTDTKILNFFPTKQSVVCSYNGFSKTLSVVLKSFTLKLQ
jgi:hypothetical protein